MKARLMRGFARFETGVTVVNGALLLVILLLILVQVCARKLGVSLSGTEELARFSYVVYTFLAWPIANLYGTNIAITMLLDKFTAKIRLALLVVYQVLMAGFTGAAAYSAWLQVGVQTGVKAPSNSWFEMQWLYAVVLVSLALCVVFNLVRGVFLLTGDMVYVTQEEQNEKLLEADREAAEAAGEEESL